MSDPSNLLSALLMFVGFITVILKLYEAVLGLKSKGSTWNAILSIVLLSITALIATASIYTYFTNPDQRLISIIGFMINMAFVIGWHVAILYRRQRLSTEEIQRLTRENVLLTEEKQDIQDELRTANETQTKLFEQKNKLRDELAKAMSNFKFEKITLWAPIRDGMAFVKILETGKTTSFDLITDTKSQIYQAYSNFRNSKSSQGERQEIVLTSNRVSETPEEKSERGFVTKNRAAIPFLPQHHISQHLNTSQFPLMIIQCLNKTNGRGHFEESDKITLWNCVYKNSKIGILLDELSSDVSEDPLVRKYDRDLTTDIFWIIDISNSSSLLKTRGERRFLEDIKLLVELCHKHIAYKFNGNIVNILGDSILVRLPSNIDVDTLLLSTQDVYQYFHEGIKNRLYDSDANKTLLSAIKLRSAITSGISFDESFVYKRYDLLFSCSLNQAFTLLASGDRNTDIVLFSESIKKLSKFFLNSSQLNEHPVKDGKLLFYCERYFSISISDIDLILRDSFE